MLKPLIAKVLNYEHLDAQEAEAAMRVIMDGNATPAQIGAYLTALRMNGETIEEITGSARAMLAHATLIPHQQTALPIYDTAGTGGDGAHSYNISTAAAFVIAGAGKKVAKHGNRSASSLCGSADVLEKLGINLTLSPEQVGECLDEIGICFIFAPNFHPAMKHAIGPRRELGQRTIFNLLGPLTNPAGATHQIIGVFDAKLTEVLANVLKNLGRKAACVFHGDGGLDELTTSGDNFVSRLYDGEVTNFVLRAEEFGLRPAQKEELRGGDASDNAQMLSALLSGKDKSPRMDVLLFNAALALALDSGDMQQGLRAAQESLESGAALAKLTQLIDYTQKF